MGAMLLAPALAGAAHGRDAVREKDQKHRAHGALLRDHVKRMAARWRKPLLTASARRRR